MTQGMIHVVLLPSELRPAFESLLHLNVSHRLLRMNLARTTLACHCREPSDARRCKMVGRCGLVASASACSLGGWGQKHNPLSPPQAGESPGL